MKEEEAWRVHCPFYNSSDARNGNIMFCKGDMCMFWASSRTGDGECMVVGTMFAIIKTAGYIESIAKATGKVVDMLTVATRKLTHGW